jgi:hypothetical protein
MFGTKYFYMCINGKWELKNQENLLEEGNSGARIFKRSLFKYLREFAEVAMEKMLWVFECYACSNIC